MILCDPFACNTLVLSIMRNLQELLSQDALPRVSTLHNEDASNLILSLRLFLLFVCLLDDDLKLIGTWTYKTIFVI